MKALAVASGIIFWTLVIGVIALIFLSGPEPAEVVQIESAPAAAPAAAGPGGIMPPPGFSVTAPRMPTPPPARVSPPGMAPPPGQGPATAPAAPQMPAAPAAPAFPGQSGAIEDEDGSVAQAPDRGSNVALASLVPGIDRSTEEPLPEAPLPAIVEDSPYGPLPKVAADGSRPADVYARPSDYADVQGGPPRVAVLLNGLGVPGDQDGDIIKGLPPPVSLAYGAYGRGLQERVTDARTAGHEVFLAIPLEPNNYPTNDPGPHALLTTLPPKDNIKRLQWAMSRYAGYIGVTNYMGAKFQSDLGSVAPVFEELKRRGLVYLADGSTDAAVTKRVAAALELEYDVADVQLDAGRIDSQLAALEAAAKENGSAIGVAKAAPGTVKRITDWAGSLESKGLVLVPVSAAVQARRQS
ncbi:divergent polysaccharide deacetylase family protein [Methyloceanibacter sp. wino2]|uniref:divergent polysaccharide deacetylase family protein n=1 Tax=Methyloceanibacter sp. wino2 TaxID=2170729 RepID=UPI000D3E4BC0|nr:divergent polysaccharide deacetylase family protein [Methyloceanibacter sp. wino2]